MYAGDRYNHNTLSFAYLKYILLLQDFSLKMFDVSFFFFFFAFLSLSRFALGVSFFFKATTKRSNKHNIAPKFFCLDYHVKSA